MARIGCSWRYELYPGRRKERRELRVAHARTSHARPAQIGLGALLTAMSGECESCITCTQLR